MSASMAQVGVVRNAPVIPKQANLLILLSFALALAARPPYQRGKESGVSYNTNRANESPWVPGPTLRQSSSYRPTKNYGPSSPSHPHVLSRSVLSLGSLPET
jgi:hypothetical protein